MKRDLYLYEKRPMRLEKDQSNNNRPTYVKRDPLKRPRYMKRDLCI